MKAALLFQGVNFLVGILSLFVFLHFLSAEDFVVWIIFASFGGLTVQLEYALQIISVRRLSRHWYSHGPESEEFHLELRATFKRFLFLFALVIVLMGPVGVVYFRAVIEDGASTEWLMAWGLFVIAYAINYFFGRNNCILLATNNTETFNYLNTLSRSINYILTASLLAAGFSILGIAFSFLMSVVLGVTLIRWQAQRVLARVDRPAKKRAVQDSKGVEIRSQELFRYTAFSFMAFFLYRGAFILIAYVQPSDILSSYGLILQVTTIVYAVAIIPTQVRLKFLVQGVLAKSKRQVLRELYFHLGFVVLTFAIALIAIVFAGSTLIGLTGSQLILPPTGSIVEVFIAFGLEAVIFTMVNLLIIMKSYRFTLRYLMIALFALAIGGGALLSGVPLYTAMIVVPFVVQFGLTFPMIVRDVIHGLQSLAVMPTVDLLPEKSSNLG